MIDWSDHWKLGCTFILIVCIVALGILCVAISLPQ